MGAFVALLVPPPPVVESPIPAEPPIDVEAERAEAFAEGRRQALAEMEEELRRARASLAVLPELVGSLSRARRQATDQAANDVAQVVLATIERVIGDTLIHRPEALAKVVSDALTAIPEEEAVTIRVHPDAVGGVAAALPEKVRAAVVPDPTLRADCVVEARHASIEAGLTSAMAGLRPAVEAWVAGRT